MGCLEETTHQRLLIFKNHLVPCGSKSCNTVIATVEERPGHSLLTLYRSQLKAIRLNGKLRKRTCQAKEVQFTLVNEHRIDFEIT